MHDPLQAMWDDAETAALALHCEEGCERALLVVLDRHFTDHPDTFLDQMFMALLESMALHRAAACAAVNRIQRASQTPLELTPQMQ